jgi:Ca-activated chloride channel family protein
MKYTVLSILFLFFGPGDPLKVSKVNRAKKQAKEAYISADYKTAISKYKFLSDSLSIDEDEIKLNLANAYFHSKDTANATNLYNSLTGSIDKELRSKAHQQLGIMANRSGKSEEALNHFKQAVKADPTNDEARYNYEMLKKKLDDRKKQEDKKDQNKDQNNKDQQNKDQQKKDEKDKQDQQNKDQKDQKDKKDQDQKKDDKKQDDNKKDQQDKNDKDKDQKDKEKEKDKKDADKKKTDPSEDKEENKDKEKNDDLKNLDPNKLKEMKISPEKAQMILDAMKNQEKQYLQQQKRKATKSRDRNKPDW